MNERIKDAVFSILIGALVAFFASLVEGLGELLGGYLDNGLAGGSAVVTYWVKHVVRYIG